MIAKLNSRHKLLVEYFIYIFYLKRIDTNQDIFTAFQISVQECNGFIHSTFSKQKYMSVVSLPKYRWNLHWKLNSKTKDKPHRIKINCIFKIALFNFGG